MGQKQESYREVTFIQRSSMEYTGGRKQVKGEGIYLVVLSYVDPKHSPCPKTNLWCNIQRPYIH